jgi:ABC-type phosphate/phosphonate transport system permease subunit
MKSYKNKQQGLIRMIIILIIAIAVLSWYGVDIKEFFTSPQAQKNFGYIWSFIKDTWSNYLAEPALKLWTAWIQYIWTPLIDKLK